MCKHISMESDSCHVTLSAHPLFPVSYEADSSERGDPAIKLVHPVIQRGLGNQNHVRPGDVPVVFHVAEERNGLQSLSETLRRKQERRERFLCSFTEPRNVLRSMERQECAGGFKARWVRGRTISSARMPLIPFSYSEISQFSPRT